MKPKLLAILIVLTVLPLAALTWLGARLVNEQREAVERRLQTLLEERLGDVETDIAGLLEQRTQELVGLGDLSGMQAETLREMVRQAPGVRQFFVLDGNARLRYPSSGQPLSRGEEEFLARTRDIWLDQELLFTQATEQQQTALTQQAIPAKFQNDAQKTPSPTNVGVPAMTTSGWYTWFWGNGIDLIFWWRDGAGVVVGAELDTMRLMADIVSILPDTLGGSKTPEGRIALVGSRGETLYQWGSHEADNASTPAASLPLRYPLNTWQLEYSIPEDGFGARMESAALLGLFTGLAAFALGFVVLVVYFYRESSRDLREAAQRVTFVNQVSHELKTPLTNIRMYAEMLEGALGEPEDEEASKSKRYLDVIVSESQRLSRLIGNILTFSRKQRQVLKLHMTRGDVDAVLRTTLACFEPALSAKGIKSVFVGGADGEVEFDRDALEQIVGNLLSNVEKYAVGGASVEIRSSREGDTVAVTVADDGPGIRGRERKRVFEPFYRVSNRLTDGVAGTGIGLAIARDLARLHGGDLTLEPSESGARFKVTLRVTGDGETK